MSVPCLPIPDCKGPTLKSLFGHIASFHFSFEVIFNNKWLITQRSDFDQMSGDKMIFNEMIGTSDFCVVV